MIEEDEFDGETFEIPRDPIAERVSEYRKLAESADKTKTKAVRDEVLAMMKRVRLSFSAMSEANVRSIEGGKEAGEEKARL
jgi:hypothetical protein